MGINFLRAGLMASVLRLLNTDFMARKKSWLLKQSSNEDVQVWRPEQDEPRRRRFNGKQPLQPILIHQVYQRCHIHGAQLQLPFVNRFKRVGAGMMDIEITLRIGQQATYRRAGGFI